MMYQERGIFVSEINLLYLVLVLANTMKSYFIGITRTLQGVVCSHVDDFFWGGSLLFNNEVICAVLKKFQISHQERATFTYLGLQMK